MGLVDVGGLSTVNIRIVRFLLALWLVTSCTADRPADATAPSAVVRTLNESLTQPSSTATAADGAPGGNPLPPPISYRAEPDGARPADPAIEALPDARVLHGYLGGAAYIIEIPEVWNGDLVMWMHGFEDFAEQGRATAPDVRRYLIANGYAWAGSSYSSTGFIPDRGADETAALWDYVARTIGRPTRTYGIGLSMGGWTAQLVAERYADRFDGVVAMCGASGTTRGLGAPVAQLLAGAYAAGVDQTVVDKEADVARLIDERIRPALMERTTRDLFEAVLVELTGGPRPHAISGLRTTEAVNWRRAMLLAGARVIPPHEGTYDFGPGPALDAADFNAKVVTFPFEQTGFDAVFGTMATTGAIQIPVLTMHTTGDGQTPIIEALLQRDHVERAGAGMLLVQRVYRDSGHCGFTLAEQEAAFDALVEWVEQGEKPDGTDLSTGDLSRVDASFEQPPRPDTPQAAFAIQGRATLDGAPFDASWIGAVVIADGLVTPCNDGLPAVLGGRFDIGVLADTTIAGCAAPGRHVVLWTSVDGVRYFAIDAIPVGDATILSDAEIEFRRDRPHGAAPTATEFFGQVVTADGRRVGSGRVITAVIDGTTCGTTSTRADSTYIIAVVGNANRAGCDDDGTITLTIDGQPTTTTVINGTSRHNELDITV